MKANKLISLIDRFREKRIAVIGDLMLDVYLWGRATRISPEAPVPVVSIDRTSSCLGGAANVMRNLVTLGGSALAFGMIGDDADGRDLCRQLAEYGINPESVCVDPMRQTTHKQRVIAGTQQLLRVDHEDASPAPARLREAITEKVLALIAAGEIDAVIFEDYDKGLLSDEMLSAIVPAAARRGIITALDPKPGNLSPVQGLTVIKPNRQEAVAMAALPNHSGHEAEMELDRVAERLQQQWAPEYLLISLAAEGMALYRRNGTKTVIPTRAREVFDVSGAGDTVVAAFTLALAAGATPAEAAEIGNYAAGIVVGKVGTVPVAADEVKKELNREN